MSDVRANSGVPVTAQFAGIATPSANAPIVFDQTTGWIYVLRSGDIVTGAGQGGTLTKVSVTFGGGLVTVSGSPVTSSGTIAFNVAGTSGGLVYFSSASAWASTAAGTSTQVLHGGGPAFAVVTPADAAGNTSGGGNFALVSGPTFIAPTLGAANATSVNFGATALNAYQEGTWTPIDASGASLTFSGVSATYTRIGRLFFASATVTYPATASALGAAIGGFPFTFANSDGNRGGGNISYTSTANAADLLPSQNTTTAAIYTSSGVATTNIQLTGATLYFSVTGQA